MTDIVRPIEPFELTQLFGVNPDSYRRFGLAGHNGWDLRTKFSDTPQGHRNILASWFSEFYSRGDEGNDGFGKYFEVIVKLKSTWKLTYAHCLSIESFSKKNEGEIMAISNSTGNSTGDHLHITVKRGSLNNGKFVSENYNNGYFGAVNPQEFFDELREFKKTAATQPTSPQITTQTKIPQVYDWEVQKIRSEIDRIPGLENDLTNERKTNERLDEDLTKAVEIAKELDEIAKQKRPKSALGGLLYDLAFRVDKWGSNQQS